MISLSVIEGLLVFFVAVNFCFVVFEAMRGGQPNRALVKSRMRDSQARPAMKSARRLLVTRDAPVWLRNTLIERPYRSILKFYGQSGLSSDPRYFLLAGLGLSVLVGLLVSGSRVLLSAGAALQEALPVFLGAALMVFSGIIAYVALRRRQRRAKLDAQFPDALNVMISALKVGHPIPTALKFASEDIQEPMAGELRRIADQIRYGIELLDAFEEFSARCGVQDGFFIAAAISVGAKTGGQLASVLERANATLRDRVVLRKKSIALASESQTTAIIMSILPIVFFGLVLVISPNHYSDHIDDPIFKSTSIFISILYIIGIAGFIRICNIKL